MTGPVERVIINVEVNQEIGAEEVAKVEVIGISSNQHEPAFGRMVPERERPDLREVFVGSYRIVYRIRAESIDILTVFEGHRSFPSDVASGE